MSRLFYVLLFLVPGLLLTVSAAFGQNESVRVYTTRDGLAGNFITAIAFEPDGSAWIGTTEGATHISDERWVSYTRTHGLGDSFVTSIAVGPDRRIWIGTQSGGLAVLDPYNQTITNYDLDNSNIPSNFITAVAVNPSGRVWVGTLDRGVAQFDPQRNKWTRYAEPGDEITAISLEANGQPWVGTPDGVWFAFGDGWVQDKNAGNANVRRIDAFDGEWYLTTDDARYVLKNDVWVAIDGGDEIAKALDAAGLTDGQVTAFGKDYQARYWLGTPRGIYMVHKGNAPEPLQPLPVVLVHGWTVAGDDTLETSEFRFLKSYADRDGIPMYYIRGVSPKNTLYQNAAVIRDEIARVKKETGADRVNMIGFSMGGMNTRAYLESTLYGGDVNRAIILGTPQAGVEVWKPILFRQILEKYDEPSAIELSPEYARGIVNETRSPNPIVPYDLLIGDARAQDGLDFLTDMPASDALISVSSALALDTPSVLKHVNADLHDWGPEAVPLDLTGYLYPRDTWERYLRNALRNPDTLPIGWEVQPTTQSPPLPAGGTNEVASNHTPVVAGSVDAGQTVTRTVVIDENTSARFVAYYPGGEFDLSLVAPNGQVFEPQDVPREQDSGVLSLSTDIASFSGYVVKDALPGGWKMVLERTDAGAEPVEVSTYVELTAPRALGAFSRWQTIDVGATNTITASVRIGSGELVRDVKMAARVAQPASPTGGPYTFSDLELFDDGKHNDGAANDGYFANDFTAARAGWHPFFVEARGDGFVRESESLFAVSPADAHFDGAGEITRDSGRRFLRTNVETQRAGEYAISVIFRKAGTPEVAGRLFHPVSLEQGKQPIVINIDYVPLPPGEYSLDLLLLDASGAAIELDRSSAPLTYTRP